MDTDKSRAAKDAANTATSGWKSAEFRRKIVNKIVDTVVENATRSLTYKSSDVMNFAEKLEETVFASATDEADYIAKVSRRVVSIKASSQSSAHKLLPLNSSGPNKVVSAPGAEERAANIDWQDPLYQRVQRLRSTYFSKLSIVYHHMISKLQQCDSAPQKMKTTDIDKYKFVKRLLEEIFMHLNVTKSQIAPDFNERLDKMEKHINSILRPKNISSHNEGQHSADLHSMHEAFPSQFRVSQEELSEKQQTLPTMTLQSSHLTKQTPQQNKRMHLQEKSTNSEQEKSKKSMPQATKESSSSQKHAHQLSQIEEVISKHAFENLPISSAGNAIQQQTDDAQQLDESFLISTPGISCSDLLEDCDNLNEGSHNSTISSAGNAIQQQTDDAQQLDESFLISTPGISCSDLLEDCDNLNEGSHNSTVISDGPSAAIQHLVKVMTSMSPKSLSESISEIREVVRLSDISSAPFEGPKDVIGSNWVVDLSADSRARYSNSDAFLSSERKMKRCVNATTLYTAAIPASTTDSFKPLTDADKSDVITSQTKFPMIEEKCALLEEIKKVNKLLIDTEVVLSEEDTIPNVAAAAAEHGEGLIVKCLFRAVSVNLNLMPHLVSNQMTIINPLWLLVPTSYPICSPILLDEMPSTCSQDPDDLSMKAKSKLQSSLRNLMHPWSVGDVAILWDKCAREAICDYAQQLGGGTFSSKYGEWEKCSNVEGI